MEVVYLENVPDEDITIVGPGKKVPLLRREPVILAVNGVSTVGLPLKSVVQILSETPRPLTMRLQIGCTPVTPGANIYNSMVPSLLSPIAEGSSEPCTPEVSAEDRGEALRNALRPEASPVELAVEGEAVVSPVLRRNASSRVARRENEEGVVRRYYRECSRKSMAESEVEEEEEESDEARRACFNEKVRVHFLLEICALLAGYEEFVRRCACGG